MLRSTILRLDVTKSTLGLAFHRPTHRLSGSVSVLTKSFSTSGDGENEADAEELAAKQAAAEARKQELEKKAKIAAELNRVKKETIEYNKKVSELRKKFMIEHKEREEKKRLATEEKIKKMRAEKPRYPTNIMFPVMDAYPKPTKEEYAERLNALQERKAEERKQVYERLDVMKRKEQEYEQELIKALEEDSANWFTEEDIKSTAELQMKVAERLKVLQPLRTSFEKVLPKNPYKLESLFQDENNIPVADKLEER